MKYPYEIQKHIPQKHLFGSVFLNKSMMADFADLIRCSPSAARVLVLFLAYADGRNSVITDCKTIGKMLNMDFKKVKYAINKLLKNGYISMTEVKLDHHKQLIGVQHDMKAYYASERKAWKIVGEKVIGDVSLTGTYNRFIINKNIANCSTNHNDSNVLKFIEGNLFYDQRIPDNELIWEV